MARDIAIFIDGTRMDHTDEHIGNILKMHRLTAPEVTSLYFRGLGNEFDNEGRFGIVGRILGGAFGRGANRKMRAAYDALSAAWQPGDRIFLFGFSRGAAIARMLASHICRQGINGRRAKISLLGCFDTVASFGLPGNHIDLFKDFHVAPNVVKARHAVAIHEERDMFPITLMNQRKGVKEMWFKGDHCDIGGGHEKTGLSDRTLRWMIYEALRLGLHFDGDWLSTLAVDSLQKPHETNCRFTTPRIGGHLKSDVFTPFP